MPMPPPDEQRRGWPSRRLREADSERADQRQAVAWLERGQALRAGPDRLEQELEASRRAPGRPRTRAPGTAAGLASPPQPCAAASM